MLKDLLPLILSNIDCLDALLRMRLVCKDAHALLKIEEMTGMTKAHCALMFRPMTMMDIPENRLPCESGPMGGAVVDLGGRFLVWIETADGFVQLDRFFYAGRWRKEFSLAVCTPNAKHLWIAAGDGELVCTLSDSLDGPGPLIFTALRISSEPMMYTSIERDLLMERTLDGGYEFSKSTVLLATWKGRAYLFMLPRNAHKHRLGALEIGSSGQWEWWEINVTCSNQHKMPLGLLYHHQNRVFLMPVGGCALFVLDLDDTPVAPELLTTLPVVPTSVTQLKVADNAERVLAYDPEGQLFVATRSKCTRLASERLSAFYFVGNTAAVAFLDASPEFIVFNLAKTILLRRCRLDHIPSLAIVSEHAIWTVEASLRARKFVRAAARLAT